MAETGEIMQLESLYLVLLLVHPDCCAFLGSQPSALEPGFYTKHIYKLIVGKTFTIHSKPRVDDGKVRWLSGHSQKSLSAAMP